MASSSIDFTPRVHGLFKILLATGYDLLYSELEYIDNSISKNSKKVKVILGKERRTHDSPINRIITYDDGLGMSFTKLLESFIIANVVDEEREHSDIGKFHVGMKSAAINQGKKICILSKELNGPLVGLFADIAMMCSTNSYEPTVSLEVVDQQFLRTHFNPDDISEFMEYSSGTLVQVTDLRSNFKIPYSNAIHILHLGIQNAYSSLPNQCTIELGNYTELDAKSIEDGCTGFETIVLNDMFYVNQPWNEVLDFPPVEVTLLVYKGIEENSHIEIYEKNEAVRVIYLKEKTKGSKECPVYYKYDVCRPGEAYYKPIKQVHISALPEASRLLGEVLIRVIQVNEAAFAKEADKFKNGDRKGFFFNRGVRRVGSGLRLGKKIHDRTTAHAERLRASVTFPAKLDDQFDSKFNKQMEDKELTCKVMNDTIVSIYKQIKAVWDKTMEKRYQESHASETEETYTQPPVVVSQQPTIIQTLHDAVNRYDPELESVHEFTHITDIVPDAIPLIVVPPPSQPLRAESIASEEEQEQEQEQESILDHTKPTTIRPNSSSFGISITNTECIFVKDSVEVSIPCNAPELLQSYFLANTTTFTQESIYDIAAYIQSKCN